MPVRQVNALRYNWENIKETICNTSLYLCEKYKGLVAPISIKHIISLEQETITVEPLLRKLAHQSATSILVCMKDGIEPRNPVKMNV